MEGLSQSNLVVGYDMVNEEDATPSIEDFLHELLKAMKENEKFPMVFHAGESNNRNNTNIADAILLGSKRIGHGFNIEQHPYMIEVIKEK